MLPVKRNPTFWTAAWGELQYPADLEKYTRPKHNQESNTLLYVSTRVMYYGVYSLT